MIPLYANGRELLTYYPHGPCGSEVGISVAVSSYNQHLFYGVTYDMQAAPDGELFPDFLLESYIELREAAGVQPVREPAPAERPVAAAAAALQPDRRAHRQPQPDTTAEPPVSAAQETAPPPIPPTEPLPAAASPFDRAR